VKKKETKRARRRRSPKEICRKNLPKRFQFIIKEVEKGRMTVAKAIWWIRLLPKESKVLCSEEEEDYAVKMLANARWFPRGVLIKAAECDEPNSIPILEQHRFRPAKTATSF